MKHTITNSLAVLLLLAIGAVGCSKEETPPDNSDTTRTPITIRVTDGGYAASDPSTAQTRVVENGYATIFTTGDQIGLYVVKPDGTVVSNNIPLTHNGTGWTGDAYWGGTGAKYFAYYPYQSALTADVDPSATDAAGFFANVVLAWTPATDQSTHALYTASDLMIGSGTASKQADGAYSLALTMKHAMALVVIEMPTTKYTLSGDADYTWTAAAPDTKFYDFTPYSPTLGFYRYLVKPAQSGASKLMGSYKAGNTKEYEIEQNDIAAAEYAHSKVDGGTTNIIEETHTLQAGDFYLKDGSLLGKDASLTNAQKAACLGVVFWVGDITNDDPLLKQKFPDGTHGLVMALNDALRSTTAWSAEYENITNNWLKNQGNTYGITNLKEENKMQGYSNTQALAGYNNSQNVNDNSALEVLPIDLIATYSGSHIPPTSSSGWYFPSVMELKYVCWGQGNGQSITGKEMLNTQFNKSDGTIFGDDYYWSSTEYSYNTRRARYVHFYGDKVYENYKLSVHRVRPLLAF